MQYPHWMLAGAAAAITCFTAQTSRAGEDTPGVDSRPGVEKLINGLPASAVGVASSREIPAAQPKGGDYLGGTAAAGRVAGIYLKLASGLFISIEQAPNSLRYSAERWVEVQFPETLGNGVGEAPALVDSSRANVEVGDAVEIRFAHPLRSSVFPVLEVTRVTAIVAKNYESLARELENRINGRLEANSTASLSKKLPADAQTPAISAWLTGATSTRTPANFER